MHKGDDDDDDNNNNNNIQMYAPYLTLGFYSCGCNGNKFCSDFSFLNYLFIHYSVIGTV